MKKLKKQRESKLMQEEKQRGNLKNKMKLFILTLALTTTTAVPAFATTETSNLTLNFDISQMFQWTQAILDVMMPILYISMGVGLAFMIVRTLRSVFA